MLHNSDNYNPYNVFMRKVLHSESSPCWAVPALQDGASTLAMVSLRVCGLALYTGGPVEDGSGARVLPVLPIWYPTALLGPTHTSKRCDSFCIPCC